MTHFEILVTILSAIVAMLATLAAGIRWIYRQGASSQKLVNAIDANTVATRELSRVQKQQTDLSENRYINHEQRMTRIEERLRIGKAHE